MLDIDGRHGGAETLRSLLRGRDSLPATMVVRTGDGFHLYFAHPGHPIPNDAGTKLGVGIDVRGEGGYVIAPPSTHASGAHYTVLRNAGLLAPLPLWIAARLASKAAPARTFRPTSNTVRTPDSWARAALHGEVARVRGAPPGSRNVALNRAAFSLGQIVGSGSLSEAAVEDALLNAATQIGLGEREARPTIASGLRAGIDRPRSPSRAVQRTSTPLNVSPSSGTVRFVPWPPDDGVVSFPAASEYVERCWTSVIGPTAILLLRAVVGQIRVGDGAADIHLGALGRALGVGDGTTTNSVMQRTLTRLEQFHLAVGLPDGSMAIRTELPPLKPQQLRRAGPIVERWHSQLAGPQQSAGPSLTR